MNRPFNLSTISIDMAFALLATFMALWPQILTAWLRNVFANVGIEMNSTAELLLMLFIAVLLLFGNYWVLRHQPSRFVPALKQHGRREMMVLLQAALFALAFFISQIQNRLTAGGQALESLLIAFGTLLLLFLGAVFRSKLARDSEYLNQDVMAYITDVLSNNPRVTQRIVEAYILERQIGGLIQRNALASLARMLMVQYFEQQNKYLHNTVIMLDSYHDPDNWKLVRVG